MPVVSTNEPSVYDVEEGRDVTLQCSTMVAKPYVRWEWRVNGQKMINPSQRNFGPFTTITLRNVSSSDGLDIKTYECIGYQDVSLKTFERKLILSVVGEGLNAM